GKGQYAGQRPGSRLGRGFRRQVEQAEYSYIVSGEGRFTPDEGQAVEFRAGDALYFAAATQGTWDIRQTVRKTYLIFD
uniref:cupin domain-containing protein n=1 Tax=Pseudomonas aeruginosa TaxID=287 RepID=UPI000666B36B